MNCNRRNFVMSNSKDIPNAYKKHLHKKNDIVNLHNKIRVLYDKMASEDFPAILHLYNLVFKNIHPDKKPVCNIKNFQADDYSDYYDEKEASFRKLFLNRDGFSISDSFTTDKEDRLDTSRTSYIHTFNNKGLMKFFRRLLENKQTIIDAIEKDYKKSIAIRFFEAFEKSGCNEIFDYTQDFDYLRQDNELEVEYYNDEEMKTIKIKFFMYKNAGSSVMVKKNENYGGRESINLNDLEKTSQIYDELIAFLNKYNEHLEAQDKRLVNFYNMLRDAFAKELILDSLKEKKEDKK